MQKTPFSHASRIFSALLVAATLLVLTGCNFSITNLTPATVPANPSQIYTITASFQPKTQHILRDSINPRIIIDGSSYKMNHSAVNGDIWEFDYQLPAGRTSASYYFICDFRTEGQTSSMPTEVYSELQNLKIVGRYVLRSEATRAPVGSRVSVLGAGFTSSDIVYFDSEPARTVFESPSSLSFFVPALAAGRSYKLSVVGSGANLDVGTFRVDGITFQVSPSALSLRQGEQQSLTFTIPQPAPSGGMLIDVTTDIAASIILPEVIVQAGLSSVTIPVQGGQPGTGSLFFKSSAGDSSIPVTVTK
ncbi:IPT/TIG domain-containing protein [Oleiharenicola lentus]|uniref:IPT/TIG domain-containing protein n=1 Tax=Oleiharenicola lentus TaxID=2508720 RepID=UPI003F677CE5